MDASRLPDTLLIPAIAVCQEISPEYDNIFNRSKSKDLPVDEAV